MTRIMIRLMAVLLLAAGALPGAAASQTPSPPCSAPEARQFDFWVGRWEVHAKGRVVGHNHISRIHGGCTLLEEYDTAPQTFEGKSFNWYDPTDAHWHQVWVDNGGTRLHLVGGYADGRMVMSGDRLQNGRTVTDRITWFDNPDGTVRQLWEASSDGGATWQVAFDGMYKPLGAAAPAVGDGN